MKNLLVLFITTFSFAQSVTKTMNLFPIRDKTQVIQQLLVKIIITQLMRRRLPIMPTGPSSIL
ncbi:hypothetical protein [Flavobacterium sp. XS2P14]|uniref:hypothetical protein n=1 Tax=Flavobacterium sp. XS2P14 TaxID=3401735 RepID=UPI003AAD1603